MDNYFRSIQLRKTSNTPRKHLGSQYNPSSAMTNTFLKHKFQTFDFVKPLYRKVGKLKPKKISVIDDELKLRGNAFSVKRKVFYNKSVDFDIDNNKHKNSGYKSLPGTCENIQTNRFINRNSNNDKVFSITNSRIGKMSNVNEKRSSEDVQENNLDKSIQALNKVFPQQIPTCWLKVYPAKVVPGNSIYAIVFRCLVCQLGLASFLVLWTVLWVFIINSYEEPHELAVSLDFKKQQNQLVIDLATELRQITPIAPKWLSVIEKRIEDERLLTITAVGRGAILHPGNYWQLAGTFLFTVYVMTALGFGAPVPQTLLGRTAALIYAVLAVPVHIYLMVNLSTCVACKVDYCIKKRRKKKLSNINEESLIRMNKGRIFLGIISSSLPIFPLLMSFGHYKQSRDPNCSRNSEFTKIRKSFRQKLLHSLRFLWVGRFVPLAAVLYYTLGAISFGVLRGKKGLDVALFPLEFTTSGGLERVDDNVRFMYAFYVEGAMTLISCMLATIRLYSTQPAYSMADQYQLFEYGKTNV